MNQAQMIDAHSLIRDPCEPCRAYLANEPRRLPEFSTGGASRR